MSIIESHFKCEHTPFTVEWGMEADDEIGRLQAQVAALKGWKRMDERVQLGQEIGDYDVEQQWIPVSERVPPSHKWVLCWAETGCTTGQRRSPEWWKLDNGDWGTTVTHWMPLPAPPEQLEGNP